MKKGYSHVTFLLDNSGSMEVIKESTIGGFNEFLKKQQAEPGRLTFSLWKFAKDRGQAFITPAPLMPFNPMGVALGGGLPNQFSSNAVSSVLCGSPAVGVGHANSYSAWAGAPIQPKQLLVQCNYDFAEVKVIPLLNNETYKCETGTPLLDAICTAIDETGKKLALLPESERPEKVFFVILTDGQEYHSEFFTKANVNERITHQTNVYGWEFIFLGANQDAIAVGRSYGVSAASSMTYNTNDASVGATYASLSNAVTRSRSFGVAASFTDAERAEVSGTPTT